VGVGALSVGCSGGGVGLGDGTPLTCVVGVGVGTVSVHTSPSGRVVVIEPTDVVTGTVTVVGLLSLSVVVTVNV